MQGLRQPPHAFQEFCTVSRWSLSGGVAVDEEKDDAQRGEDNGAEDYEPHLRVASRWSYRQAGWGQTALGGRCSVSEVDTGRRNATVAMEALSAAIDAVREDGQRLRLRIRLEALRFALEGLGWATPRGTKR